MAKCDYCGSTKVRKTKQGYSECVKCGKIWIPVDDMPKDQFIPGFSRFGGF
tara:strand:+ start:1396 stop:1548 length:153 start_codon:yes stop_codon:yes gene_type:complete